MKKLFILLLSALSLAAVAQQKPKIAVYMTGDDPINEIVSNRLVDDFARGNEYTTVERTASFLAELSKEHAYERSGEVDDEQIAALGRQFNVQYVCVVSVLDVWNTEKYITARIIDTETAEVIASCSSNGSIQNSSELIGALNTLSESFFKAMRSSKRDDAKKVAVYVSKTGNRDVDIVLGDQLVSGFARSGRYVAIERTNSFLKKLKDEQGYQQSGAVADDDLTRWGQQFGVQYICVAKSTSWAGDYFITTRMVDVKTGEVVNSYKVEGRKLSNSRDVVGVAQEIAAELSKGTLAEQAVEERLKEEARLKAEKEARLKAEEEARLKAEEEARLKAEKEARLKAEEARKKAEKEARLQEEKRKAEKQKILYANRQNFTETVNGVSFSMIYVAGGRFTMGRISEQGGDCEDDEKHANKITLSGYYIGMTEVTQELWQAVMGTSISRQRNKKNPYWLLYGVGPDYPMYYVSWAEAMEFCNRLSQKTGKTYTLPTEAQWEYAARGGNRADGTKYAGSNKVDAVAWYTDNSRGKTHPCGTKRGNALGIYDMSGNVSEWCKDWYSSSYKSYDTNNPTGPSSGSNRVVRGGGWCYYARGCRVTNRISYSPSNRFYGLGFRVVLLP